MSSHIDVLVARFPRLFRARAPDFTSYLPDGWTGLVERLFADLDNMLDDDHAATFVVLQIKEKFGTLRIYWSLEGQKTGSVNFHSPDGVERIEYLPDHATKTFMRINARVTQAVDEAASTCERCGSFGESTNRQGFFERLCPACRTSPRRA